MELYGNLSRLYTLSDLARGADIALPADQVHYLRNVLRKNPGDSIRLFNGRDGEWRADITGLGKKSGAARTAQQLKPQPPARQKIHLLFAPIKKNRLDILVEKAVELGATDLHPAITNRTEIRSLNENRLRAQIVEAAEQCERMDVPVLHACIPLKQKIQGWDASQTIYWCRERFNAPHISGIPAGPAAFLTGPEGGFDDSEIVFLQNFAFLQPVSLGTAVYRAETAALICLVNANKAE